MQYRALGKTGLQVSEVGFGAWAIGGNQLGDGYGATQDEVSLAALQKAYELGCTLFDTADIFGAGHSETLIGQALQHWDRSRVVITTKVGNDFYSDPAGEGRQNFSETYIRNALAKSLERLGVDYVDLYLLQNPSMALIQHGKVFEVMKALKGEGKIRHYGISIHDPMEGVLAIDIGGVEVVQAPYHLFDRRLEKALIPHCEKHQVGLIAREPLANGFLTGKFTPATTFEKGDRRSVWPKPYLMKRVEAANQFLPVVPPDYPGLIALALKFVLASPVVTATIPGCKTPQQVQENLAVSDLPDLDASQLKSIESVCAALF
jgi:aryl-alcohol dehydrogenase-like predicted oxidoreductase